uniref:Cytochrome c553 n=1 Tax=Candidatus Kentrum sp. DK TaxID=2126562 RepID=A0A450TDV7_9GAMM|nr:MAG: Cytochrome c553 [Candidatus Kentron sp. DK]
MNITTPLRFGILFIAVIFLLLGSAMVVYWALHRPEPIDEAARQIGEKLALAGREGIAPCTACHGANGEGNFAAGYPRLAGLHPEHIAKQLQDFARDPMEVGVVMDPIPRDYNKTPRIYSDLTVFTPGTRADPVMNSMAGELTPTERKNLGVYFGNLPFTIDPQAIDFQDPGARRGSGPARQAGIRDAGLHLLPRPGRRGIRPAFSALGGATARIPHPADR